MVMAVVVRSAGNMRPALRKSRERGGFCLDSGCVRVS